MSAKDELLALLIKDPTEWIIDHYYAIHTRSGLKFWVANGFLSFGPSADSLNPRLGFLRMWVLWQFVDNIATAHSLSRIKQPTI